MRLWGHAGQSGAGCHSALVKLVVLVGVGMLLLLVLLMMIGVGSTAARAIATRVCCVLLL